MYGCKETNVKTIQVYNPHGLREYVDFPETHHLKGITTGPPAFKGRALNILSAPNGFLIIKDFESHYITLFDTSWNVEADYLPKGEGPFESLKAPMISKQNMAERQSFLAYDFPNKLYRFTFPDPHTKRIGDPEIIKMPEILKFPQRLMPLSTNLWVSALSGQPHGKCTLYDIDRDAAIKEIDFVPKVENLAIGSKEMFAYNGVMAPMPSQDRWVFANHQFNQLEIYDFEGELLHEMVYGEPDYRAVLKGRSAFYYYALDVSHDLIFALYLGKEQSSIVSNLLSSLKPEVHVFSKDGVPVAKFLLDRLINDIALHPDGKRLIGIDETHENRPIVQYRLPDCCISSASFPSEFIRSE